MNDVCSERHKNINDKIDKGERRLDNHSDRIDSLEQSRAASDIRIDSLIKEITNLVSTMKWFTGLGGSTLLMFFIWYIQKL